MQHNTRLAAALFVLNAAERACTLIARAQDENRDPELAGTLDAAVSAACSAVEGPRAEIESALRAWASAVVNAGADVGAFGSLVMPAHRWRKACAERAADERGDHQPDPRFEIECDTAFDALRSAALATTRAPEVPRG